MSVSKTNTRVTITINKELKKELDTLALKEKCSVSKLCSEIIKNYTTKNNQIINKYLF